LIKLTGSRKRVLVIGLDGVTWDLIIPWMNKGKLPILKKTTESGASCRLASTVPCLSAPAWASLVTGRNPGGHGIFGWVQARPKSYEMVTVNSTFVDGRPLWDILGEADIKVGVVNVPICYPAEKVNGFLVSGILTPRHKMKESTYPPSLYEVLTNELDEFRFNIEPGYIGIGETEDLLLRDLYHTLDNQLKATIYLMNKCYWDFFFVVFMGTDNIQHFFWKYMDPKHPQYNAQDSEKYGQEIQKYYQKLDGVVGDLIDHAGERTMVIILSDHGFGPKYREILINNWLLNEGLLKTRKAVLIKELILKLGLRKTVSNLIIRSGLIKIVNLLSRNLLRKIIRSLSPIGNIDWSKTRAYSLTEGTIYINLKGRQPNGIVEAGEEYETLRDKIIRGLLKVKDPLSGDYVVEEVVKKEELYSGPHLKEAPDLVAIANNGRCQPFITDDRNVVLTPLDSNRTPLDRWSGTHRRIGIATFSGDNIVKNKMVDADIVDIAPTILYLLGLPIPSDIDGKVLENIIDPSYLAKNPIKYLREPKEPIETRKEILSEEDEEKMRERLVALGYL